MIRDQTNKTTIWLFLAIVSWYQSGDSMKAPATLHARVKGLQACSSWDFQCWSLKAISFWGCTCSVVLRLFSQNHPSSIVGNDRRGAGKLLVSYTIWRGLTSLSVKLTKMIKNACMFAQIQSLDSRLSPDIGHFCNLPQQFWLPIWEAHTKIDQSPATIWNLWSDSEHSTLLQQICKNMSEHSPFRSCYSPSEHFQRYLGWVVMTRSMHQQSESTNHPVTRTKRWGPGSDWYRINYYQAGDAELSWQHLESDELAGKWWTMMERLRLALKLDAEQTVIAVDHWNFDGRPAQTERLLLSHQTICQ